MNHILGCHDGAIRFVAAAWRELFDQGQSHRRPLHLPYCRHFPWLSM